MATNRSPVMPSSPAEAEGRTHFTPEEARVLVDQCFVEFKTRLTEATRTSLELAVDLFESHSHIPDGEVEQFRTKRGEWLERFAKTIDDLYAKRMAGHQRKGRRPDPDASAATLKVLSAFDHDKQQALTAGTSLLRRFTTTAEIANLVVYLCSPAASATHGAALRVEGGILKNAF